MTAIMKKELRTYFSSWIGYVFLFIMIGITGVYFALANVMSMNGNFQYTLSSTTFIFLLLIPMLTMRLFAEEAKQKTDQLIFTAPLTVTQIVFGKFLAAFLLFISGTAITVIFPITIMGYGIMPTAQIISSYAGYILTITCLISIGLFVSTLTDNQIISAVISFAIIFVLNIMDGITSMVPTDTLSSTIFLAVAVLGISFLLYERTKNYYLAIITAAVSLGALAFAFFMNNLLFDGIMVKSLQWLSLWARFNNFTRGILDIADIVYYISFSAAFLYLTVNIIEKRRWR